MAKGLVVRYRLVPRPNMTARFTMQERPNIKATYTMKPLERNHEILYNRDKPDQHPISAITGLQDALDSLQCKTFVYEQGIASNTWVIEHNLGKIRPSITVVDSADTVVGLFQAEYVNDNKVILHFNGEFVGKAYLN